MNIIIFGLEKPNILYQLNLQILLKHLTNFLSQIKNLFNEKINMNIIFIKKMTSKVLLQ